MIAKNPGVPAGGDCELLQVLLRVNERVFRPAGGRDGLCGCFAIFIAPQMTAGYLLQPPDTAPEFWGSPLDRPRCYLWAIIRYIHAIGAGLY